MCGKKIRDTAVRQKNKKAPTAMFSRVCVLNIGPTRQHDSLVKTSHYFTESRQKCKTV